MWSYHGFLWTFMELCNFLPPALYGLLWTFMDFCNLLLFGLWFSMVYYGVLWFFGNIIAHCADYFFVFLHVSCVMRLWFFMVFYGFTEFFVHRFFVRFFSIFYGVLWNLLGFSAFRRSVGFLSDKRIMYIPLYIIFKNAIIFTYFYARFLLIIVEKSGIILP